MSSLPVFNKPKHNAWEKVSVHTAKCDKCHKHNTSVIQRCKQCNQQFCRTCIENCNEDGAHEADASKLDWVADQMTRAAPKSHRQRKPRAKKEAPISSAGNPTKITKQSQGSRRSDRVGLRPPVCRETEYAYDDDELQDYEDVEADSIFVDDDYEEVRHPAPRPAPRPAVRRRPAPPRTAYELMPPPSVEHSAAHNVPPARPTYKEPTFAHTPHQQQQQMSIPTNYREQERMSVPPTRHEQEQMPVSANHSQQKRMSGPSRSEESRLMSAQRRRAARAARIQELHEQYGQYPEMAEHLDEGRLSDAEEHLAAAKALWWTHNKK